MGPWWPPTLFLFLLFLVLVLSDLQSAKAFSFHNRSSPNFAYTYVTTLSTITLWQIFKLSSNQLIIIRLKHQIGYTAAPAVATAGMAAAAASAAAVVCPICRRFRWMWTWHAAVCGRHHLATRNELPFLGPHSYMLLYLFPKRLRIFSPNFTRLLYVPIYARLQIFIQLPATLMKLCHIKRDHPVHTICPKWAEIGRNACWHFLTFFPNSWEF